MTCLRLQNERYAFIDVETTGVNPWTDRVVEVAILVLEGGEVRAQFETLVDPGVPIPAFATAIHGITDSAVRGAPKLAELEPFVHTLCRGAAVVAHNACFDLGFLRCIVPRTTLCTLRLARRLLWDVPDYRNQTLRRYFSVNDAALYGRSAHRAMADAIVTRHIYFHLLERYAQAGGVDSLERLVAFSRKRFPGRFAVSQSLRQPHTVHKAAPALSGKV